MSLQNQNGFLSDDILIVEQVMLLNSSSMSFSKTFQVILIHTQAHAHKHKFSHSFRHRHSHKYTQTKAFSNTQSNKNIHKQIYTQIKTFFNIYTFSYILYKREPSYLPLIQTSTKNLSTS